MYGHKRLAAPSQVERASSATKIVLLDMLRYKALAIAPGAPKPIGCRLSHRLVQELDAGICAIDGGARTTAQFGL